MRIDLFTCFFSITTLTIFCFITIPVHSQCLEDQKSLLLQLKNSLQFDPDSSVKLVNWTQSNDCCQWNGVTCDHSGRVIGLDLNMESISGGLNHSSSLFRLKFLEKLNLAYNNFNLTPIPSSFGVLTSLTYLNLSYSGFVGQIPMEFSRLTRLVKLDISTDYYFLGIQTIKIESPNLFSLFRNLSGITELRLDGVNISVNGYEWGQAISSALPNLRVLSLRGCFLSGPIDSSLQNLHFLSEINLDSNNLTAPLPNFFANFSYLKVLSFISCNLYGTFPGIIFEQVQTLETLNLASNALLEGTLPDFPQNLSLRNLVLSFTSFSGNLPQSIGNLMELRRMEIPGCNFSGQIPNSLANLSHLVYLDFSSNNFSGQIPSFQESENLTYIDLSHNTLTGVVLSTHFEGLSNLVYIDLASNSFIGSIPSSLFSLPSLQKILLSNNKFGGQITRFSNEPLSPLDTLDLSSNELEGPIPSYFFDFRRLHILSLSFNKFGGTVELGSIQTLRNLTRLELSYNNLTVDVSADISSLSSFPQLNVLSLASCNLKKFPALINQSRIIHLDLSDNQISGVIPSWVWNVGDTSLAYLNLSCNLLVGLQSEYIMPSLGVLDLHSNQLGGDIPLPPETAIYVDYSRNKFNSSIPSEIGFSIGVANFLSLSDNMLSGPIPPSICNGSNLQVLDLSNNGLSGTIPQCLIDNCTETLGILNLGNNSFSGHISGTFPQGCALKTLDLNRNHLEGPVPESLSNCTNLEVLNLGSNKMNDNFTCFLKNSSNLRVLVLRSNDFQGGIRCPEVSNQSIWPRLQIIDLSWNKFSGELPPECFLHWNTMMIHRSNAKPELDYLRYEFLKLNNFYYQDKVTVSVKGRDIELVKIITLFTAVDFSGNSFEGEIPDTIGALSSLHVLNMSRNALSGQIPSKLGKLTQLESLDLSVNKLNGRIPETLTGLTFLSVLNLSHNQLVGRIPEGHQFQTFSNDSFLGNAGLYGFPLSNTCNAPPPVPSTKPTPTFDEEEINWVYITATLGYTVGLGVIVGPLLYCKRWRQCYYKHIDRAILRILHHQERRARRQRRRDNRNVIRRRQHH